MIKLLFLIPTLDKGGAENVLLNLVNSLDKNKYDITVQTLFDINSQKVSLKPWIHYISSYRYPIRGYSKLFAIIPARILYKNIVKDKYDIAISYLEGPTTRIICGCPFQETKTVAWIHTEMYTDRLVSVGFATKKSAIKAYQKFDRTVFVAQSAKKRFEEISREPIKNSSVLYNTIDSDLIYEKSKITLSNNLFDNNCINVISIGKLAEVKGFDRLAKVHKKLLDQGINHHIYILGEGKERTALEKYINSEKINNSFTLLGFQDNPYQYMRHADLFICSSRREGLSTAVAEALILGLPVVSTRCSGAEELLGSNNEYGIVVDNSEEGIYEGLYKIITSEEMLLHYRKMAQIRGKMFSKSHTISAVEKTMDDLFFENNTSKEI